MRLMVFGDQMRLMACGADMIPTLFITFILILTILSFIFKDETRNFFEDCENFVEDNTPISFFISAMTWWVVALGAPPGDIYLIIVHAYFLSWLGLLPIIIFSSAAIGVNYFVTQTLFVDTLSDLRKTYCFGILYQAVNQKLFYITLIIRLSYPIIPFGIANLILSLLSNDFLTYFISSILSFIVYSVPLTYISKDIDSLSEVEDIIHDFDSYANVIGITFFVFLIVLLCVTMLRLSVKSKKEPVDQLSLQKRSPESLSISHSHQASSGGRSPKRTPTRKEQYTLQHMIEWFRQHYKVSNVEEVVQNLESNQITGKIFMGLSRNSVTDLGVNRYHAADILSRFHESEHPQDVPSRIPSPRVQITQAGHQISTFAPSPRTLPMIIESQSDDLGLEMVRQRSKTKERQSIEISVDAKLDAVPSIPDPSMDVDNDAHSQMDARTDITDARTEFTDVSDGPSFATVPMARLSEMHDDTEDSSTKTTFTGTSGHGDTPLNVLPRNSRQSSFENTPQNSTMNIDTLERRYSYETEDSATRSQGPVTMISTWDENESSPRGMIRDTVYDYPMDGDGYSELVDSHIEPDNSYDFESEGEDEEEVQTTNQIIEDSDSDSESLSIDGLENIFIYLGSKDLNPQQLERLWDFYDRQGKGALYKSDLSNLLLGWVEFQNVDDEIRKNFKRTADERALIMLQHFKPEPPGVLTRKQFGGISNLELWDKISFRVHIDVDAQWRDMWKNVFIKLDEASHLSTDSIFKIWLRYETQGKMDIDEFELMLGHWGEEMKSYYQKEGNDINMPDSNTIRARATIGKNFLDEDRNGVVTWNEFVSIREAAFWKSVDFD